MYQALWYTPSYMYRRPINLLHPQTPLGEEPPAPQSKKTLYLMAGFIFIFLTVLLIMRHYALAEWPSEPAAYDQKTLQPRSGFFQTIKNFVFHSDAILEGQQDDRINILLLGIGGPGHDGPYLSDTNIIMSIKPSTKEVALISIPRDLGVNIPGHGWRKINYADAYGESAQAGSGGDYARQIFSDAFKIYIPYYIRADFTAFTELVDAVGGVTINVPTSFTDQSYPGPNFSYTTIHFDSGLQTMNGERALEYSRSRHGTNNEASDFARSHRQQLVLQELKQKMLSLDTYANPIVLKQIMDSLAAHVMTNLNFGQLMYLASLAKEVTEPPKNIILDNSLDGFLISTTADSGAYMLSPKTGNFDTINLAIEDVFTPAGSEMTSATLPTQQPAIAARPWGAAKVEIQNGTWLAGLASRVRKQLEDRGFSILAIGNSLRRPVDHTAIYLLHKDTDSAAVSALASELKVNATPTLPDWLKQNYDNVSTTEDESGMKYNRDADVLVVLGTDFKE